MQAAAAPPPTCGLPDAAFKRRGCWPSRHVQLGSCGCAADRARQGASSDARQRAATLPSPLGVHLRAFKSLTAYVQVQWVDSGRRGAAAPEHAAARRPSTASVLIFKDLPAGPMWGYNTVAPTPTRSCL